MDIFYIHSLHVKYRFIYGVLSNELIYFFIATHRSYFEAHPQKMLRSLKSNILYKIYVYGKYPYA